MQIGKLLEVTLEDGDFFTPYPMFIPSLPYGATQICAGYLADTNPSSPCKAAEVAADPATDPEQFHVGLVQTYVNFCEYMWIFNTYVYLYQTIWSYLCTGFLRQSYLEFIISVPNNLTEKVGQITLF